MKISILGYGPIPEKLARELSVDASVELFTSQEIFDFGVPIYDYDSFLAKDLDFDVLILAWRGLPQAGTQKAKVLRYLVEKSPTDSLIINLSSVSVYGQNSSVNTEETEPRPINDYGYSKLFLERYLNIFAASRVCNLRISNVFGHPNFDDITNRMLRAAEMQVSMEIVCPDEVTRDFVSIDTLITDLSSLILVSKKIVRRETFNISSGNTLTLAELRDIVENCLNTKISFSEKTGNKEMIFNSTVSNYKLRSFLKNDKKFDLIEIRNYLNESIPRI